MKTIVKVNKEKNIEELMCILADNIKERAKDVARDLEGVSQIVVHAELNPFEIVKFKITKTFTCFEEVEDDDLSKS